jgi:hypothetical protein
MRKRYLLSLLCWASGPCLAAPDGPREYEWEGRPVRLLASAPVVITIDDILTQAEADHLVKVSEPKVHPARLRAEYTPQERHFMQVTPHAHDGHPLRSVASDAVCHRLQASARTPWCAQSDSE